MATEKPLFSGQFPSPSGGNARLDVAQLVDEEEWWAVRKYVGRIHEARAFTKFLGVSSGEILYQTSCNCPDSSTKNADRVMPS